MVYTNTVPSGHMRAPGATLAALAGEEHVDHIARELGMDPLEFRLLNALRPGDTGPMGEHDANPRAVDVLETVKREVRWYSGSESGVPSSESDARRHSGPAPAGHWVRGRGLALRHRDVGQGKTEMVLRMLADGTVEALYAHPGPG